MQPDAKISFIDREDVIEVIDKPAKTSDSLIWLASLLLTVLGAAVVLAGA